MRKFTILGVAIVSAGALWAVDPSITLNRVQQRYPWNGMVDIDYTVADVPVGSEARYFVRFKIVENGNTHTLHEFLDTSTLYDASNGTYRVTWNSAWEDVEYRFFAKTANVQAELVYCGSHDDKPLGKTPYGNCYMIIDLTKGTTESDPVATTYPVETRYVYGLTAATNEFNTNEYKTNKLVLRRVRAGTFIMGSPEDEYGRQHDSTWSNKETQHQVTLTQNFLLGMYEVTQAQYFSVMGTRPSYHNNGVNAYPVEQVSYQMIRGSSKGCAVPPTFGNTDEASFMGKISARTGLVFDLPTEAQWEYACRAGTTDNTYAGPVTTSPNATTDSIAWNKNNGNHTTHIVGGKIPNAWGFYDILGNVWEICRDRVLTAPNDDWGSDPITDPLRGVNECVSIRGAGWWREAIDTRAACRNGGSNVSYANESVGFRLSRTIP